MKHAHYVLWSQVMAQEPVPIAAEEQEPAAVAFRG